MSVHAPTSIGDQTTTHPSPRREIARIAPNPAMPTHSQVAAYGANDAPKIPATLKEIELPV